MSRPTQLSIDLSALRHNFNCVKNFAPGCLVMAMVKANAYGHGIEKVAAALEADALGVASLEEGLTLREAGIKKPIVLMEGLFNSAELTTAALQDFTLIVHHPIHIEMLEK